VAFDWVPPDFQHHYGKDEAILVGGVPTPLKNMKVSWDDYSQYMKNKESSILQIIDGL
jgi:hypothetical protein